MNVRPGHARAVLHCKPNGLAERLVFIRNVRWMPLARVSQASPALDITNLPPEQAVGQLDGVRNKSEDGRPTSLQSRRRRYSIGTILKGIGQTIVPIPLEFPGNPFASARTSCIGHGAENITIPGGPGLRNGLTGMWEIAQSASEAVSRSCGIDTSKM
jgi:hypothetical protein